MIIYKIEVKNLEKAGEAIKDFMGLGIDLYFEDKETAESTICFFNEITFKNVEIEWECTKIHVLSYKEAKETLMGLYEKNK